MAQLTIKTREVDGVNLLDLAGKIMTGEGAVELREAVQALLQGGKTKIVLNLREVDTIDSSGVGELVASYTATLHRSGKLRLMTVSPKIHEMLLVTQLISIFQVYDSEAEAISSF